MNLEFDTKRKPTFSNRFITSDSYHNYSHKMAVFHAMFHRLVKIPLKRERYDKEKQYIIDLITNMSAEIIYLKHQCCSERTWITKISYIFQYHVPESTKSLSRTYEAVGYEMVNCNHNTIQMKVRSAKDEIPHLLKYLE